MSDELKLKMIQELSKGNTKIGQVIFEVNGNVNYYNKSKDEKEHVTDEQVSKAIISINGNQKPLNEKQLFLGVICVLLSKYGWTGKISTCCTRINSLPMKNLFEKACDYNSVKVLAAYRFASVDYKDWECYEPSDGERVAFWKCKAVADAFDEALSIQEE